MKTPGSASPDLVVFKVTHLGDTLLCLPGLQTLRAARPDLRLLVFTSPLAAPLLAGIVPGVDLSPIPWGTFKRGYWRHPGQWLRWLAMVRAHRGGIALIGQEQGTTAHLLARAMQPRRCIAWAHTPARLRARITHPVVLPDNESVAQWEWRLTQPIAEELGVPWPDRPPAPNLAPLIAGTEPAVRAAVVIHPGASLAYKRWPRERFAAVAAELARTFPVVWIEGDANAAPLPIPGVTSLIRPPLAQLIASIASARLLVGNNSGPMHLASALGTPSVILTGPSSPVWDPAWHTDRITMLRPTALPCAPCDRPHAPADICRRTDSPLACLMGCEVRQVIAACLTRLARA